MGNLSSLRVRNFRNIEAADLEFFPGVNVLVGKNAQGKTNLLEAILYLATSTTPRTRRKEDLVRRGEKTAFVSGLVIDGTEETRIEFGLERQAKRIKVNGNTLSRVQDLYGQMRVVFFAPEDLEIIGGSPAERRRFLDMGLSQVEPETISLLLKYDRAVKQRNNLLRRAFSRPNRSVEPREIDVWDEQCAKLGAKVICKRHRTLLEIAPLVSAAYERLAGHGLTAEYVGDVWDADEGECEKLLAENLLARRDADRQNGATSVGPHRDDLRFRVEDKVLRSFGSQGERRTAALALRLAEVEFQRLKTGSSPILLIDDVIYEMDPVRRGRFLDSLHREGQIIFTVTDLSALGPLAESSRVFRVDEGRISPVDTEPTGLPV